MNRKIAEDSLKMALRDFKAQLDYMSRYAEKGELTAVEVIYYKRYVNTLSYYMKVWNERRDMAIIEVKKHADKLDATTPQLMTINESHYE